MTGTAVMARSAIEEKKNFVTKDCCLWGLDLRIVNGHEKGWMDWLILMFG